LPRYAAMRMATSCDINRHEMPPILGSNCSSYCSTWAGDPRASFWRPSKTCWNFRLARLNGKRQKFSEFPVRVATAMA
jgi:hypothetical protein